MAGGDKVPRKGGPGTAAALRKKRPVMTLGYGKYMAFKKASLMMFCSYTHIYIYMCVCMVWFSCVFDIVYILFIWCLRVVNSDS